MRYKIKYLIPIFLSTIIFISSCSKVVNIDVASLKKNYVLNINSKKVHSLTCKSVELMSYNNREDIEDTLLNICKNGYKICKNCNAGINKKDTRLKYELFTKEDYLKAIDEVGEWYVNHVPTYQKNIQTEFLNEYKGNNKFIKEYVLQVPRMIYKFRIHDDYKIYNVISTLSEAKNINLYDNIVTYITKANENAIMNYKNNYDYISFESYLAYYDCPYLYDSSSSYTKAGDDCVRFVFTILNSIDKDFIKDIEDTSGYKWKEIDTKMLNSIDKKFINAMKFKGFEIYDTFSSVLDVNNDNVNKISIKRIDDNFKLQNGDLIVRNGHIHVFKDDKMVNASNFGWGHVSRTYPQYYDFQLEKKDSNYYIICNNGFDEKYNRVYRYVGDK